ERSTGRYTHRSDEDPNWNITREEREEYLPWDERSTGRYSYRVNALGEPHPHRDQPAGVTMDPDTGPVWKPPARDDPYRAVGNIYDPLGSIKVGGLTRAEREAMHPLERPLAGILVHGEGENIPTHHGSKALFNQFDFDKGHFGIHSGSPRAS